MECEYVTCLFDKTDDACKTCMRKFDQKELSEHLLVPINIMPWDDTFSHLDSWFDHLLVEDLPKLKNRVRYHLSVLSHIAEYLPTYCPPEGETNFIYDFVRYLAKTKFPGNQTQFCKHIDKMVRSYELDIYMDATAEPQQCVVVYNTSSLYRVHITPYNVMWWYSTTKQLILYTAFTFGVLHSLDNNNARRACSIYVHHDPAIARRNRWNGEAVFKSLCKNKLFFEKELAKANRLIQQEEEYLPAPLTDFNFRGCE